MLIIDLPPTEETALPAAQVRVEHSLVSVHKWEAKYEKPFFGKEDKTPDQTYDYIEFMNLDDFLPPEFKDRLTPEMIMKINDYINSKQSATWFREDQAARGRAETVTAELIYYWMIQFQIPSEYRFWHLNQLMILIKICGVKQTPPKKMNKAAQMEEMRRLNAERLKSMGTTG